MRESEKIKERLRKLDDTIDEQMPGVMARSFRSCFRRYRALPERAKFAIAFSTGATLQQTIINTAVSAIKLSVGSFVVLETMAFCGIIGEPGESIMEWIEDHDDELKERFDKKWGVKTKSFVKLAGSICPLKESSSFMKQRLMRRRLLHLEWGSVWLLGVWYDEKVQ